MGWIRFTDTGGDAKLYPAELGIGERTNVDGMRFLEVGGDRVSLGGKTNQHDAVCAELDRLTKWLSEGAQGVYVVGEGPVVRDPGTHYRCTERACAATFTLFGDMQELVDDTNCPVCGVTAVRQ